MPGFVFATARYYQRLPAFSTRDHHGQESGILNLEMSGLMPLAQSRQCQPSRGLCQLVDVVLLSTGRTRAARDWPLARGGSSRSTFIVLRSSFLLPPSSLSLHPFPKALGRQGFILCHRFPATAPGFSPDTQGTKRCPDFFPKSSIYVPGTMNTTSAGLDVKAAGAACGRRAIMS